MERLFEHFYSTLYSIGMESLKHPVFYNAPIGIRFKIGGEEDVYMKENSSNEYTYAPDYVLAALKRAETIYTNLPCSPHILRIDGYPDEEVSAQELIFDICNAAGLPQPHEQVSMFLQCEEDVITQLQLYWDLRKASFRSEILLREIIKADIGGYSGFASSVYFADTKNSVLFHLYDDRGADLVAARKDTLYPVFEQFGDWILDYDRDRINSIFA